MIDKAQVFRYIDTPWFGVKSNIKQEQEDFIELETSLNCRSFMSIEHMQSCLDDSMRWLNVKCGYKGLYKIHEIDKEKMDNACKLSENKLIYFKIIVFGE